MIHHLSLGTNDVARARRFYDPVLAVLGLRLIQSSDRALDYGTSRLFFSIESPFDKREATPGNGVHVCFDAEDREMVDTFYRTGLQFGGRDGGAPGLRPNYDENYYGAFLFDPDGNKIEAVTYGAK